MDVGAFIAVAYRGHRFCNPLSEETLDRVLSAADLRPGGRALDLGCGNAAMSVHLAERYGLQVDAVELAEPMLALARPRIAQSPAGGRVVLHHGRAEAFLQSAERYDLIVAAGAYGVITGLAEPRAAFALLKERLTDGGALLLADIFWRRPPGETLRQVLPGYHPFADYVRQGEAAGLSAVRATESPRQDWDDYAWRMYAAVQDHARERPDAPELDLQLARARFMRDLYLEEMRDAAGFGLWLFRREAAY